jgi:hypothetical protein
MTNVHTTKPPLAFPHPLLTGSQIMHAGFLLRLTIFTLIFEKLNLYQ